MPIMVHAFSDVFAGISQLLQPLNSCALADACLSSEGEGQKNDLVDMTTEEEGGDGAELLCGKVIAYSMDNILVVEQRILTVFKVCLRWWQSLVSKKAHLVLTDLACEVEAFAHSMGNRKTGI